MATSPIKNVNGGFFLNATNTVDTTNFSGTITEYVNTGKRVVRLVFSLTTKVAITAPSVKSCGNISSTNYLPSVDSPGGVVTVFNNSDFDTFAFVNKNSTNKTIAMIMPNNIASGRTIAGTFEYRY